MTAQRPILFTALLLLTALAPLPASGQSISSYSLTLKTSCPASCRDVTSKKPIGTYSHTVTYRYEVDMNAWDTTGNYIPDYDFMRLEISPDGLSRYYSTTADRRDSIMYRARTDVNHRGGVDLDSWKPEERFALYEDTYLNWPEAGELTVRTGMVKEEFEYTEPVPQMTWQFLNIPPRTVCGYQCMAAGTTFRGRQYTVWFAPEIPISAGPWKFSGLPGLILAVEESSGIFSWEVIGVSQKQGNIHIHDENYDNFQLHYENRNEKQTNYRIITRRQAVAIDRRRWADPWGFALDKGIMVLSRVNENSRETVEATSANREQFALPEVPALELE